VKICSHSRQNRVQLKRLNITKVSSNNTYQECLHINFHDKHYVLNLRAGETWKAHDKRGEINCNLGTGQDGQHLNQKKKKKKKAGLDRC